MYSEKTFKNYIFWIQAKRVVLIILLSCIGCAIGVLIGKILESTMSINSYNTIIIIVSTLIFFALSLLLTAGTGKEVQDGYWKIAVLRKLTTIQKDLELNNELLSKSKKTVKLDGDSNELKEESELGLVKSKSQKPMKKPKTLKL